MLNNIILLVVITFIATGCNSSNQDIGTLSEADLAEVERMDKEVREIEKWMKNNPF